jgi:hypothetical protein
MGILTTGASFRDGSIAGLQRRATVLESDFVGDDGAVCGGPVGDVPRALTVTATSVVQGNRPF